jgi:exosortase
MNKGILRSRQALLMAGLLLLLFGVYLPTIGELGSRWATSSEYSHGVLVPGFALALVWLRREKVAAVTAGWNGWGIVLLLLGGLLRLLSAHIYFDWLDAFSLLPSLAGVAVFCGGWAALRWSWPAIAFLIFMIPLPYRLEVGLGFPLQRIATLSSTYILQTLGLPALAEGNVVLLTETRLGIIDACSGLSMLLSFFALSTAVVLLIHRPLWERAIILISAVPIGVAANVTRIACTGILHETAGHDLADLVFHDLAGWLMMPLGLALLWLEMRILNRLLIMPSKPLAAVIPRSLAGGIKTSRRETADSILLPQTGRP